MSIPTTVRMDKDMIARLDGMAQASGHSRAFLIKDAIARYIEYETWFASEVDKGREDAAAGRLLSHEEVKARMLGRGVHVD